MFTKTFRDTEECQYVNTKKETVYPQRIIKFFAYLILYFVIQSVTFGMIK